MNQQFRNMILARSGEDRLKMGCSLHSMAQARVKASLQKRNPDFSPNDLRRELFLRFYEKDFDLKTVEKILKHLEISNGLAGNKEGISCSP